MAAHSACALCDQRFRSGTSSITEVLQLIHAAVSKPLVKAADMAELVKEGMYDKARQQLLPTGLDLSKHSCCPEHGPETGQLLYSDEDEPHKADARHPRPAKDLNQLIALTCNHLALQKQQPDQWTPMQPQCQNCCCPS